MSINEIKMWYKEVRPTKSKSYYVTRKRISDLFINGHKKVDLNIIIDFLQLTNTPYINNSYLKEYYVENNESLSLLQVKSLIENLFSTKSNNHVHSQTKVTDYIINNYLELNFTKMYNREALVQLINYSQNNYLRNKLIVYYTIEHLKSFDIETIKFWISDLSETKSNVYETSRENAAKVMIDAWLERHTE